MKTKDIFELMEKNPAFFLATVDGDKPKVRGMLLYKADSEGIIFHTGKFKDLYNQISENQNVELCFNDFSLGIQVRIEGSVEMVNDENLKDEISNHPSRKFLDPWKESLELKDFYESFVVLRMISARATTWAMESNFLPKEYIDLFN